MEGPSVTTTADFKQEAQAPGTKTDKTLAEILGTTPAALADELGPQLSRIREAEREAERTTAEVRLY